MPKLRLDRRAVLKGAGSIAIALPWLEIMSPERRASAAVTPAQRFLAVYTPGGTVVADAMNPSRWRPTGTEDAPILSPILAPLESIKHKMLVVDGLAMTSAVGEQSQAGMIAWLTGSPQADFGSGFATGPSLDQVLARRIAGPSAHASVQMAVRWGTRKAHGKPAPIDIVNFADDATFTPIAPAIDPVAIWHDLFGGLSDAAARRAAMDRSILDYVDKRYVALARRLGANDKRKLDQHLTALRELERRVMAAGKCVAPVLVDTSGYDPASGTHYDVAWLDTGTVLDPVSDAAMPKVGKLMMDMMVMAMTCDLTRVGTMQWSDSDAGYSLPWLGLPQSHYYYENGGGYRPAELELIYTWYSTQHAYLLTQMDQVDMGGHSLLDESVVFFGTEVANPATHVKRDMPFLLGGGGGLRGGRWVQYPGRSHNDLLIALLNLFGDMRTTFGNPTYCTGPLPNLT